MRRHAAHMSSVKHFHVKCVQIRHENTLRNSLQLPECWHEVFTAGLHYTVQLFLLFCPRPVHWTTVVSALIMICMLTFMFLCVIRLQHKAWVRAALQLVQPEQTVSDVCLLTFTAAAKIFVFHSLHTHTSVSSHRAKMQWSRFLLLLMGKCISILLQYFYCSTHPKTQLKSWNCSLSVYSHWQAVSGSSSLCVKIIKMFHSSSLQCFLWF